MDTLVTCGCHYDAPHDYFKKALSLSQSEKIMDALQSMDAAIVFSHNAPFYIYQKIRLLYQLGAYKNCSQLIVSQLDYFYKHASLYLLCRSLHYFQAINHFEEPLLSKLLQQHHVPYALASCYETLLIQKDKPFFEWAKKARRQDDYPLCLCYCDLALKLHPDQAELYFLKVEVLHLMGQLIEAQKTVLHYQALMPDDPEGFAAHALIAMELGNYEISRQNLEKALALSPESLTYLKALAECYALSRHYLKAIDLYKQLIYQEPDQLQYYFDLSHLYQKTHQKRLAKRYLKQIQKTLKR